MSRDPIGYEGGVNLYGYVGGDPINYVDPTGTEILTQDQLDTIDNIRDVERNRRSGDHILVILTGFTADKSVLTKIKNLLLINLEINVVIGKKTVV
jgi:uncharacterized protein RhaS with RHS repeats